MTKLQLTLRRNKLDILVGRLLVVEQGLIHRIKDFDQAYRQRLYLKKELQ